MKNVASFKEKFITLLKDAEQTGEIITKEKVDEFFKDLKKQTGPWKDISDKNDKEWAIVKRCTHANI